MCDADELLTRTPLQQMNVALGIARRMYRPVLRSSVTFVGVVLVGAAIGEIFFDGLAERLWTGLNRGKLFEDLSVAKAVKKD